MTKSTNTINEDQVVQAAINELGNAFCAGIIDFVAIAITIVAAICLIIIGIAGAIYSLVLLYNMSCGVINQIALNKILIGISIISIVSWAFVRTFKFIQKEKKYASN